MFWSTDGLSPRASVSVTSVQVSKISARAARRMPSARAKPSWKLWFSPSAPGRPALACTIFASSSIRRRAMPSAQPEWQMPAMLMIPRR